MRFKIGHRFAAVAALTVGGAVMATGSASASANGNWVHMSTAYSAGIYAQPDSRYGKTDYWDVKPGFDVFVDCWSTGQNINNLGDVWYKIDSARYSIYGWVAVNGWVYGAYVDNNNAFHTDQADIAHC